MRQAADAGNDEAQYALATFYKEGTGVEKNMEIAVRLLQAASLADNVDAEVEYAIALYNGTGTPRNQPAAVALLRKAAKQGSAIAQNRLARVLVSGQGAPMDKVEGFKWHLVAKTQGKGDPMLDDELSRLSPRTVPRPRRWRTAGSATRLTRPPPKGQPVPQAQAAAPCSAPDACSRARRPPSAETKPYPCSIPPSSMSWSRPRAAPAAASSAISARSRTCRSR